MRLVARDPEQMEKAGYAALSHIPFLIRADGTYPDEANRYIRVRSLCEWELRLGNDVSPPSAQRAGSSRIFLTPASAKALARRLGYFLTWCEASGRDWRAVSYQSDLVLGWQKEMLEGEGTKEGRRLSPATINARVSEACYFLSWAGEDIRALRPPFLVSVKSASIKASRGDRAKGQGKTQLRKRVGALPVRPSKLYLPGPEEIGIWMKGMRSRYVVKSLMSELIIETGIRISECNEWRVNTLPEKSDWVIRDGCVVADLRHGIKGAKLFPGSTESVKPREVEVPLDLASRIDHYRSVTRPNQIARWIRGGKTKEERNARARAPKPERLWLSEATHQPFANEQLRKAWTSAPGCPRGWHPHSGREYCAVETVVRWLERDLATRKAGTLPDLSWIQAVMRDQIRLILAPKLGHVSEETSMIYLKAAHARLAQAYGHPSLRWQMFCDGDMSDG